MRIGFVGCGYVADYYMETMKNHPDLTLRGVYDIRQERNRAFSDFYGVPAYDSFEDMLKDEK